MEAAARATTDNNVVDLQIDPHFPDTVRSIAERILRQVGNRPSQALPGFLSAIEKNRGLMSTAMMWILNEVAEDIRRADAEAQTTSGRHISRETQSTVATGGSGGTSQTAAGIHSPHARPALPTEAQKAGARTARRAVAVSILEVLQIRDQPIGRLTFRELRVADRLNKMETEVITRILQHSPNADPNDVVQDVISNRTLLELTKDLPEVQRVLESAAKRRRH